MNLCLLFNFYPPQLENEIRANTKRVFQDAATTLQNKIIKGLTTYYKKIDVINAPLLGYYYTNYKNVYSPEIRYQFEQNGASVSVNSFKFNTIPVFFHYTRKNNTYKFLKEWIRGKEEDENVLLIYAANLPAMESAVKLKQKYKNIKIILIIADLPEFMIIGKSFVSQVHKYLISLQMNTFAHLYTQMDGFVLLTESMNERVNKNNAPYVVMEGIADESKELVQNVEKYVLYSGSLSAKYGILNLVNAFKEIKNKQYKLLLCGFGDAVPIIKQECEKNKNIEYLGQLPRQDVERLQRNATLLINPRQNVHSYTKYSFPSKVMEYFMSGRPTLMYKLDGIPDEYYKYCFYLEDNSISAFSNKIDEILSLSDDVLYEKGSQARNYVIKYKNPAQQCSKIKELIDLILMTKK